jgi:hypothetical protein
MPYDPLSDADIERVALGLLDRTLPKPQWTHAGHFAAALWLLRHLPDVDLPREMPAVIRSYNEAVGGVNSDTAGYHETITQASLRAARAFLHRYPPSQPLSRVLADLLASPLGHPDWLLDHWSKPRLFSVAARRSWVEPDLQPLPF